MSLDHLRTHAKYQSLVEELGEDALPAYYKDRYLPEIRVDELERFLEDLIDGE